MLNRLTAHKYSCIFGVKYANINGKKSVQQVMHAPYNIPNKNLVFTNRSSLRTCHAKLHQFTLNVILVCYIAVQNIDYSQTTYQSNKGHGTT